MLWLNPFDFIFTPVSRKARREILLTNLIFRKSYFVLATSYFQFSTSNHTPSSNCQITNRQVTKSPSPQVTQSPPRISRRDRRVFYDVGLYDIRHRTF